jgi:hypothetical protein
MSTGKSVLLQNRITAYECPTSFPHSGVMRSFFTGYGVPDRIRTYDLRLRKPTLYPAELRVHVNLIIEHNRGNFNMTTLKKLDSNLRHDLILMYEVYVFSWPRHNYNIKLALKCL